MTNALDLWRSNKWMHPLRAISRQNDPFERMLKDIMTLAPVDDSKFEFSPTCEITEQDKTFELKFDLPGVKKEHIKVDVDGDLLTIRAERREEKKQESKKKYLSEISYGSYVRSFTLPEAIEEKNVDAKFVDGVLTVTVPKTEFKPEKQAKQIEVK
jgi:HSP20 family protein